MLTHEFECIKSGPNLSDWGSLITNPKTPKTYELPDL